jgi:alpha-D-ribose 1-methylphosphonate 5-triphosphate synthase subunit PhnI
MRTTITLDDDIFQAAQAQAQASGKKLGEVVSLLARRGLKAVAETTERKGLPVFKVSREAPVIPSDRAGKLLSED